MRKIIALQIACIALILVGDIGGRHLEELDVINNFCPILLFLISALSAVIALGHRFRSAPLLILTIFAIGIGAWRVGLEPFAELSPPETTLPSDLIFLTHNVMVKNRDTSLTNAELIKSNADIVALQESDGNMRGMLDGLSSVYPFGTPCPVNCSIKILSKTPIIQSQYKIRDADGKQIGPPLVWAKIQAPDGHVVTVISIHYPWQIPPGRQALIRQSLAESLKSLDTGALILAGDMNLTPWTYAMQTQDEQVSPLSRITLSAWSWPSWWKFIDVPFPFLPIDHIYIGPELRSVSLRRLPSTGSDHYPILVTLRHRSK